MPQSNHDPETSSALREAEALDAMFASQGWEIAERIYNEYVNTLKDVTTIDTKGDMHQQLRDRINVVAALTAWRDDMKGRINNARMVATPPQTSTLIERR
jgi:hypothetical protein